MCRIVGRDTDLDTVSLDDFNPVFLHPSRKNSPYHHIVVTFNFHGSAAQNPVHNAFQLD